MAIHTTGTSVLKFAVLPSFNVACVAGAKRGGRGGGRKAPPSLSPTPFDACYAG